MQELIAMIEAFFAQHGFRLAGSRIGIALSGGADSMALLHGFLGIAKGLEERGEPPLHLILLHFNHGLNQFDEDAEALSVKHAAELGLDLRTERARGLEGNLASMQNRARLERYAFFSHEAAQERLDFLALAHTQNDQAETVIKRAADGAWWDGLAGISPHRQLAASEAILIRPLLGAGRVEIRAHMLTAEIPFIDDPDNSNEAFQRARVRAHVLPALTDNVNWQADVHLARLGVEVRELQAWAMSEAMKHVPALHTDAAGAFFYFERDALAELPRALRYVLLRECLMMLGIDRRTASLERIDNIASMLRTGEPRVTLLTAHVLARVEPTRLMLCFNRARSDAVSLVPDELRLEGDRAIADFAPLLDLRIEVGPQPAEAEGRLVFDQTALDASKVVGSLRYRTRLPGDQYQPVGSTHEETLRELLRRAGMRLELRRFAPVIFDDEGILWVPGIGLAARAALEPDAAPGDGVLFASALHYEEG